MADTALFVGWGGTYPGREVHARKHFAEWLEILGKLEADHEIERFETILLDPHGGELDGFTLVFAPYEKLVELMTRDDLHQLRWKASLDHARFSVLWGVTGEGVFKEFELFDEAIAEYREPALV